MYLTSEILEMITSRSSRQSFASFFLSLLSTSNISKEQVVVIITSVSKVSQQEECRIILLSLTVGTPRGQIRCHISTLNIGRMPSRNKLGKQRLPCYSSSSAAARFRVVEAIFRQK
jgi:hypothetical protein